MATVTVIIPTFGNPKFLCDSIISVLNQTFTDLELIIVDDNNPDTESRKDTEELVNRLMQQDSRVKYLKHMKNMNGAVARNTGFAVAQGKYISFLDSDDEYMPDRLQKCFDVMENASDNIAGVYTGCEFRRGGKLYHIEKNVKPGNFLVDTLACTFNFCTGSNIFVRKSVVDKLNGFDGSFLRHQDYEFLVRVFEQYDLAAIPEALVIKNNENFNLPNLNKLVAIKKQYLDKFKYIIDTLPEKDVNYIMHGNYINVAENAMAQNNFKVANEFYSKASRYGGMSAREWFRRLVFPIYNIVKGK